MVDVTEQTEETGGVQRPAAPRVPAAAHRLRFPTSPVKFANTKCSTKTA
jgi:hypothetical protein